MNVTSVVARIYLAPEQLETSISFYERLLGQPCRIRFIYAEAGIELAAVGSLLLIAGAEVALEPLRAVAMTISVSSLSVCRDVLLNEGATIVEGPQSVPTGLNMHVRHADGTLVEYVQLIAEKVVAVNLVHHRDV